MRRTFILHASGSKLPTDLLGLTCVRYDGSAAAAVMKVVCQKLRNAIENEGRVTRERPLHPDAPQLDGTGDIRMESGDRASGTSRHVVTRTKK